MAFRRVTKKGKTYGSQRLRRYGRGRDILPPRTL